ncbi:MAG TPA: aldo/keto reductase [Polyangiaceae bacterium]
MTSRPLASEDIPALLYGTAWKEERTRTLTELALRAGFRGVDTANQRKHYFEAEVGAAVRAALGAGSVRRNALFLQTKFTFAAGQDHRLPYDAGASVATQVQQSFASSLEHLGTETVDSYLLHGPSVRHGLARDDWEAWRAMEALASDGKARSLGVSNVSVEQLEELFGGATVKPRFVQNRCYARTGWDRDVRAFCREHGVVYQAFSLLTANSRELKSSVMRELARRTGRPSEQLVFAFAIRSGMLPLTGTSNLEHMQLDLAAADVELERGDLMALETIAE